MEYKLKITENFQTVELTVDCEDMKTITETILMIRSAIIEATPDVEKKKAKKEENAKTPVKEETPKVVYATDRQIRYLVNLGIPREEAMLMTSDEASAEISRITGR